jgi:5-methylcytosine-specific restriction endonuclease McrA
VTGPRHGTQRRYKGGCRCDECRAGVAEAARRFRERYQAKHGVSYRTLFKSKPEQYGDRHRRRDAARRARKSGATVESFTHAEIFERDGWTCGICTEPVDLTLRYPHPLSSSLDHVVPLSRGGEHSRVNTRLAHLVCNQRRGARVNEDIAG